jgi:hypothetical protein
MSLYVLSCSKVLVHFPGSQKTDTLHVDVLEESANPMEQTLFEH